MLFSAVSLAALLKVTGATVYNLREYQAGNSFINAFTFLGGWNDTLNTQIADTPNNGDDFWTNLTQAESKGMVSVDSSTNHVLLKVDNSGALAYNQKRYSLRLESNTKYGFGTVWVFDAYHLPFGCSVWPAYWTSADDWPAGGEIDIMENVNMRTNNQMVFHTGETCILAPATGSITGTVSATNCTHSTDNNAGCSIADPSAQSFGAGFNSASGGMWVTEFAETGISIWFFTRASIPAAITTASNSSTIDTSTLGTPVAQLPSNSGCEIANQFEQQKVIINISLCGDFAGVASILNSSGCPVASNSSCYDTYVTTGNFSEAYFEIGSHRVFTLSNTSSSTSDDSTSSASSSSSSTKGGSTSTSTSTTGDASRLGASQGLFAALVLALGATLL